MPSMTFLLTGRDELSDVFDDIGDAARRMGRRIHAASMDADREVRRFTRDTTDRMAAMRRDTDAGGKALEELGKVTRLISPAAIPAAASLVPLAAGAATAGVAMAAMGAAIGPQISALGEASTAQKAYEDAVAKSGARSQEAITAQTEYQRTMAKLPPATREAAAAVGILKTTYADWSDDLAGDTMAPFIKGVAVTNALLPKTSGLVKAASQETDRFMTILGGEMSTPGLDGANARFTAFAQKTLRGVNDGLVHLLRTTSGGGKVGGNLSEFMTWARAQGPTVSDVLSSVATALLNVLRAGSDVGVGLLDVIQGLSHLVSAVPPGAIAVFLQLALALKVTKAAALGMAAGRTALAQFGAQLVAMRTAAAATPGSLAAARAAIMALSRTAKLAIAGTGIGLLIIGLTELAQHSEQAPPDVDKLTSSLKQLGSTGRVTGEAAKAFGADLGGLHDKVASLTDPSNTDKVQQWIVSLGGLADWDSTPVKEAKENLGAVDEALANLVKGGDADLAAAAVKHLAAEYAKGGHDSSEFTGRLKDYKGALADARFEQQLAAESMGLFGSQAQSVQEKLDGQKRSADGLRQSIQALNDLQRQGIGGMIGFEASIDAAAAAAKKNAGALSMSHGELDLNSEKARTAASALNDLAAKTDEAATQARESGASWTTVNGIYERGRSAFLRSAEAMGLTKREAAALADQILKVPNKTTLLKGDVSDLDDKITKAQSKVDSLRQKRKTAVGADKADLDRKITAAQTRVDNLRQKRAVALRAVDQISRTAQAIVAAIAKIRSKTVTLRTVRHTINVEATAARSNKNLNGYAGGGTPRPGEVAWVGENGPELMSFSGDERIFDHGKSMSMIKPSAEAGRYAAEGLAVGMSGAGATVGAAARAMAAQVTAGIREELEISSPSKKTKALMADVGKGMIIGLTGSQAKIKSTAKDLAKDIWSAFSGSKDNRLVAMVNRETSKLLTAAKKRDALVKKIAEAKAFASDITKSAREGAGLSNLGMEPEEVTAGGIQSGLAGKLAKIKQFTRFIGTLAKRGLNKGLLRQILGMGPEAGYAYASALAGADKATITSVNKTQSAIDKASTSLGRLGADRMYDSGKNASKGFLKGLESQEKDLEKLMTKIAKRMQKALRDALGIRSPARKLMPDGVNTVRGIAAGVIAGLPHVDRAMDTVAGRIAGRGAISPVAGRGVIAARGSEAVHVQVDIHGALDPVAVAKEVQRMLLKLKRDQGGLNVSLGVA
jgi:chorismate mutase